MNTEISFASFNRRYIITRCDLSIEDIVHKEVEVCDKTARLYSNNYYSWTHRIWFVQFYCKSSCSSKKAEVKFHFLLVLLKKGFKKSTINNFFLLFVFLFLI